MITTDKYVTGAVIKSLREKFKLTQVELSEKLNVTDKTISKWETGKGYPDITLLEPIAKIFNISVTELISGNITSNLNLSSNMLRSHFYICPVCGNVVHSMGEMSLSCHGISLLPETAEPINDSHNVTVDRVEDELFISINHEMTKTHYISFIAALTTDNMQFIKLYPEGPCECRIKRRGLTKVYFYCNKDGLFCFDLKR